MIKKAITVFSLLLFCSCSHTVTEVGAQTKDYEQKQQTNLPIATAQAKSCKGYALFFIPYGDTNINFTGITEEAIRGGKIQIKGLKDINLSGTINIKIETTKSLMGSKKCLIIEGNLIVPELNEINQPKHEQTTKSPEPTTKSPGRGNKKGRRPNHQNQTHDHNDVNERVSGQDADIQVRVR